VVLRIVLRLQGRKGIVQSHAHLDRKCETHPSRNIAHVHPAYVPDGWLGLNWRFGSEVERQLHRHGSSYVKPIPRSLRLTHRPWPITRWSSTSMSSSLPAATISRVTATSSGEGVGSPLGWLCTTISETALCLTASRNSSPTRMTAVLAEPW